MLKPGELKTNPLLTEIAPQPNDQRQFVILIGYVLIDESSQGENTTARVYPVLDLRTYLEIRIDDLVYHEKAIPGQETSPTKLVMKPSAEVKRVTTTKRPVEAEFLSGSHRGQLSAHRRVRSVRQHIDQPGFLHPPACRLPPGHNPINDCPAIRRLRRRCTSALMVRMNTPVYGPDQVTPGLGPAPDGSEAIEAKAIAMLDGDDAIPFLLEHGLVERDWIITGDLTLRSAARRNRNLRIEGPGGAGYLIKQPDALAPAGRRTLTNEAAFYEFCHQEAAAAPLARLLASPGPARTRIARCTPWN